MRRLTAWLVVNDVTTGSSDAYPELQPLDLELTPDEAYGRTLAVARQMAGWQVVAEDPRARWLEAEATSTFLRFVDEIRVWVEARDEDGCRVQVRSRSRTGRGDFGANARRVRTFLRLVGTRSEKCGFHRRPADTLG